MREIALKSAQGQYGKGGNGVSGEMDLDMGF